MQVEAAIPVFARPWQSLLTGYSLLASSPGLVSRVWWEFRGDGPFGDSAAWVAGVLRLAFPSVKFVVWNASHSHPAVNYPAAALDRDYRLGFPFQRAWEGCGDAPLLLLHNDVEVLPLALDGALSRLLGSGPSVAGVGKVGMCHACPAHNRGCSGGQSYESFQPNAAELRHLIETAPPRRLLAAEVDEDTPWPIGECRLNEWFALVWPGRVRRWVFPVGTIPIVGERCGRLDGGVRWFGGLARRGYRFLYHQAPIVHWAGFPAFEDSKEYFRRESAAREKCLAVPRLSRLVPRDVRCVGSDGSANQSPRGNDVDS